MALGMKHWAGLLLAGCAFVALEFLPPSSWEPPTHRPLLPEETYAETLSQDVGLANAELARIRLADRLIPLTLAADGPLAFGAPDEADPEEVARFREDAELEARVAAEGSDARVALGLFYVSNREGSYREATPTYYSSAEYYYGSRDGRPYCVTVVPVWRGDWHLSAVADTRTRLGLCQVIARYGLPGPAADAWLVRGGTALAAAVEPSGTLPFTFVSRWGLGFARHLELGIKLAGRTPWLGSRPLEMDQCFAGVAEGCAALFLSPSIVAAWSYARGPDVGEIIAATPLSAVQANSLMEPADHYVVADLAEEFGVERFERWWTADGPTDQAFLASFGVPTGDWYTRRVARLITVVPPGPSVRPNGLAWSVVFLALAALIGGAWARRRRVA